MVHELMTLPHVIDVYSLGEKEKGVYELSIEAELDTDIRRDLFALLSRKGWPMMALKNTDLTLEDLFLQLTSSDTAAQDQEPRKGTPPIWTPTRTWSWTRTRTRTWPGTGRRH